MKNYAFNVGKHIDGGDSDDGNALRGKPSIARLVTFRPIPAIVRFAINLYR